MWLHTAILKTHNVQTFNPRNYFAALINMDWTRTVYCMKNKWMKSTFTVNLYTPILVTYSVNKAFCRCFLCILTPGYVCSFHHPQDAIFNRWERVCYFFCSFFAYQIVKLKSNWSREFRISPHNPLPLGSLNLTWPPCKLQCPVGTFTGLLQSLLTSGGSLTFQHLMWHLVASIIGDQGSSSQSVTLLVPRLVKPKLLDAFLKKK